MILVFHSYMWEYGDILQSYGPERLSMMHAYRTAINMGIPVAGHSDLPISAANPLLRIQDMVTRTSSHGLVVGANQKVSVDEALKLWTLDGAFATFEENIKGSITPGKLADFLVLAKDPRKVPPSTIKDIRLEQLTLVAQRFTPRRSAQSPWLLNLRLTTGTETTAMATKRRIGQAALSSQLRR